jgi:hypothetical protein
MASVVIQASEQAQSVVQEPTANDCLETPLDFYAVSGGATA